MDQTQIKKLIAEKIPEGYSLSKIQDLLKEQGVQITFMELRLLASEIEEEIFKAEEEKAAAAEKAKEQRPASPMPPPAEENAPLPYPVPPGAQGYAEAGQGYTPPQEELEDVSPEQGGDASSQVRGKTVVELSKIARPGVLACGSVKFGSGVTAEWILDQMQRLGLENATGQPDQQDIEEFKIELQKLFS